MISPMTEEKGKYWLFKFAIPVIAFLVYANSLGNGFVMDDTTVIIHNAALRGDPLALFVTLDTNSDTEITPYYRPLTILTFLIEERLHGLSPFPMHFFSVLLHAVNAFLVYFLARSLIKSEIASLLVGLVFAVHPINTEAVDFLSARNTLLSCLFIISSYLMHEKSVRKGKFSRALAGAILFMAGLFSKETTIMVLPFILFLELSALPGSNKLSKERMVTRLLPYVVLLILYLVLRGHALTNAGVRLEIFPGLWSRLLNNLFIIPKYILTIIWPLSLNPEYDVPDDFHVIALPLTVAWLCIAVLIRLVLTRGRNRATLFGLLWMAAFWLPVSGIIHIPSTELALRYLYVPAIGLWLVVADQTFHSPVGDDAARRYYGMTAVALVLLLLSLVTLRRNLDWKNEMTFFSRAVDQYPDSAWAHNELGDTFYAKTDPKSISMAEQEYETALALNPNLPKVHIQLGSIQSSRGEYEGALQHYSEALALFAFDKGALLNRGAVLEKLGRYQDAIADYQLFLKIPDNELNEMRPYAEDRVRALSQNK